MAKIKTINSVKLLTAEQALEKLLHSVTSPEVKIELERWLQFGHTSSNSQLRNLTPEQLTLFLDKITDLLLTLYCIQQQGQKGDRP